jgi:hypothetical protein
VTALDHVTWALFEGLKSVPTGIPILAKLDEGLLNDEHVIPLADRLRECSGDAARLLHDLAPVPPPPPTPVPATAPPRAGKRTISKFKKQSATLTDTLSELRRVAEAHPSAEIDIEWEIRE